LLTFHTIQPSSYYVLVCVDETSEVASVAATPVAPPARRVPAMYGWAIQPPPPPPTPQPEASMRSAVASSAPSKVATGGQASTAVSECDKLTTTDQPATAAASVQDNVCKERRRRQVRQAQKVRYAPVNNCPFVSCGPSKPLRTFREKPDSCLPRRK